MANVSRRFVRDDEQLVLVASWDAETELFESAIEKLAADGRHLEILEAGCGQRWPLELGDVSYRLTGIDLDRDALAMRVERGDLADAIHGDLRSVALPDEQFDVIYNSFVLEHVAGAETVLDNFVRWAKPGAVMLIRFPDRDSVFGFVTRVSPHWFHVFYKRYIVGNPNAGKPGHEPYPTVYDQVISRGGFRRYCESRGLVIQLERGFPVDEAEPGMRMRIAVLASKVLGALSFGRLSADHIWLTYVVAKPTNAGAGAPSETAAP